MRQDYSQLKERLKKWASELTEDQAKTALVELVAYCVDTDSLLRFWDDSLAPYYESCGEPLVPGQKCFPEDE